MLPLKAIKIIQLGKKSNRMKTQGLRTTIYTVDDLEKAKQWYTKAFEIQPYFDEPFYVGFNIVGYELGLMPEEKLTEKGENIFAYWGVEDIEQAFNDFLNLGASVFEKPTNVGGEITVAAVKDPWNNIIGIIYNPEFKLP